MADQGPEAPCAVVILAAGKSTRMNSARTKVLHGLAGRPVIAWLIETVQALDPTTMVGVIGPDMDDVAATLRPHPTTVQHPALGTAHALRQAEPLLTGFAGDVLVLYGDTPLLRAETLQRIDQC